MVHVVRRSVRKRVERTSLPRTRRIPACVSTCARFRRGRTRASARCRSRRRTSRSCPTSWRSGTVSVSSGAPSPGRRELLSRPGRARSEVSAEFIRFSHLAEAPDLRKNLGKVKKKDRTRTVKNYTRSDTLTFK